MHHATNGAGHGARIDQLDARLDLVEASLTGIRDTLDTRIDVLVESMGAAPNPTLGHAGRGLLGSVARLLEADAERVREERERDKRLAAWERRRTWASALVAIVAGVTASLYYAGILRH